MTIQFAAFATPTSDTGELSGTFRGPQGRFSAGVNGLFGKFAAPTLTAPLLTELKATFGKPFGFFTSVPIGDGLLRGIAANASFFGVEAPPPATAMSLLSGYFPAATLLAPATIGQTTDLLMQPRVSGLFVQDGAAALRGTFGRSRGVFTQQRSVSSFISLLPQSQVYIEALGDPIFELRSSMSATDSVSGLLTLILRDAFAAADSVASLQQLLIALRDGASFNDRSTAILQAVLNDLFTATDSAEAMARLSYELRDGMAAHDELVGIARIMAELHDSFFAYVTLRVGNDVYTAWVMTPETRAMRQYSNWPFNSYTQRPDGAVLAAGPAGVYRLGASTDAGAAITSAVRTGLMDFDTARMKRIDKAYLGYSSTGDVHLKVCATSVSGTKVEYVYKMVERKADSATAGRIDVGRGVKSVYWSFELVGNDLELFDMTILPMTLTGRFGG